MVTYDAETGEALEAVRSYSVSALLRYLQGALTHVAGEIEVTGEIHAVTQSAAGHCYVDLKDTREEAIVKVNIFRGVRNRLSFSPKAGNLIAVRGAMGIYLPRGQMSLTATSVRLAGEGNLFAQFMALKDRLQQEGLFDRSRKVPIPLYSKTIGIVTSLEAAALQDVLRTLTEHAPHIRVIVYPALVQGAEAPRSLIRALQIADARHEVECVLLVRGGGSLADLWCFNDEALARTIAEMRLPVVSGVGHETDTTIADLVADARALTPTAAAMMVSEPSERIRGNFQSLLMRLRRAMDSRVSEARRSVDLKGRLERSMRWTIAGAYERVDHVLERLPRAPQHGMLVRVNAFESLLMRLRNAAPKVGDKRDFVENLRERIQVSLRQSLEKKANALEKIQDAFRRTQCDRFVEAQMRLDRLRTRLESRDVMRLMEQGFAFVTDSQGKAIHLAASLHVKDTLTLRFKDGRVAASVDKTEVM